MSHSDLPGGNSPEEDKSSEAIFALIYDELRRLACQRLSSENDLQSLTPTALVHEAFLRLDLGKGEDARFENRAHLFSVVAEAMRWILIDRARMRDQIKRGGRLERVDLAESQIVAPVSDEELLSIDEALRKLESEDPESADLVKMRFFSGFSLKEIASATGVSYRTIKARWSYARTWLRLEIEREGSR